MSLNGTSTRTEVHQSNQQVAEVLFTNEDKQTAKKNENKPPSVDSVSFSNTKPRPGDNISAQITGSDPENMALMWEWSWIGKGVKQSGDGTGTTLNLSKLQVAKNANNNDTYGIELKLTDELGAYVTHKQEFDGLKPPDLHRSHLRVSQVQPVLLQEYKSQRKEQTQMVQTPIFNGNFTNG